MDSIVGDADEAARQRFRQRFPQQEFERYTGSLNCFLFTYPVDELTVRGIYIRPKSDPDRKLPVIIANRGGNGAYAAWTRKGLFHTALPLANEGFVVLASQYRGSHKGDDPEVFGRDEFGGRDVDDVLALFEIIDRLPGADAERIGMYGWSRGGMMSLLVARRTDRLDAVALGGTPTDLAAELEIRPEMERVFRARIPGYDEDPQAALEARSALRWAEDIDPGLPILILHGEADKNVSLDSAQRMAERLRELGRSYKLVVYEDGSHGLLEHNAEVRNELAAWFGRYLR